MNVWRAELETRASGVKEFPDSDLPEVAFLGRSNVGKSSLINTLLQRKNLARTSSTPGKTRAIFFYRINENIYLVDLPGYGYAKVSKKERHAWGSLVEDYLAYRSQLRLCVQIIDIRHPPQENDALMVNWLRYFRKPFIVVATKEDKISRGKRKNHLETIRRDLELSPGEELLSFSAVKKSGREEIWDRVISRLD